MRRSFKDDAGRVKRNGPNKLAGKPQDLRKHIDLPNNSLKLLLLYIGRNFAVDSTSAQGHCEGLGHVLLYGHWDVTVLICGTNPDLS